MMFRIVLLGFLLFTVTYVVLPTQSYAMSLDDEEEDAEDVADLLAQAKKAGKSESFAKAEALLKKAKMYGVSIEDTQKASDYVAGKKQAKEQRLEKERKEKERLAQLKREQEQRAREASARQASSSYGLPKNMCYRTSGNYALNRYCNTGNCNGFVSNYALHQLCEYDSPNGFHSTNRNTNINLYLRNGGYLSYDYFSNQAAYQSGKHNESFQSRKNYILYLLSGMVLIQY